MSGIIGTSVPRRDAQAKVMGTARYTVDLKLPNMLIGKILRSPLAHARIRSIDVSRARQVPGVKAILTGADVPDGKMGLNLDHPILAKGVVRCIGEEVAAVAAVDADAAAEALALIKVDFEELPAIFDPRAALAEGAIRIHEKGNIMSQISVQRGNPDAAWDRCAAVAEGTYHTPRAHQAYMEPQACLAQYDPAGRFTIWVSTQVPFRVRSELAGLLGIPETRIRVIQPYVGGGFGGKAGALINHVPLAALLSQAANRPVRIVFARDEDFMNGRPRLPVEIWMRMGADAAGNLLVKQTRILADGGAYSNIGPAPFNVMCSRPDNLYRFQHMRTDATLVYTNNPGCGGYRGFGNPQGTFAAELTLDKLAAALKMDPTELRHKNATRTGDVTIHGWRISSSGFPECIEAAKQRIGWDEKKAQRQPGRGLGMAACIHVSGNRIGYYDGSEALVTVHRDGSAVLLSGEGEIGQGAAPLMAQIVAHELGIALEKVEVPQVDTDTHPFALGAFSSRVTTVGGKAVALAAQDAKRQLLAAAARRLEIDPADLEVAGGHIQVKGDPQRRLTVGEAVVAAMTVGSGTVVGRGFYQPPTLDFNPEARYGNSSTAYSFAVQAAEVQIDPDTGRVEVLNFVSADDVGKALNPSAVEGQVFGGVAQGLGYALSEELKVQGGKVVNANFADYAIPTTMDMPELQSALIETNDPLGPYGAKGASEDSLIPVAAAIANAVRDAVGVEVNAIPITAERMLNALRQAGGKG